jgi:hypothetical protein
VGYADRQMRFSSARSAAKNHAAPVGESIAETLGKGGGDLQGVTLPFALRGKIFQRSVGKPGWNGGAFHHLFPRDIPSGKFLGARLFRPNLRDAHGAAGPDVFSGKSGFARLVWPMRRAFHGSYFGKDCERLDFFGLAHG